MRAMVLGYAVRRVLWMLPTLLGISVVTFLLMDLAPVDRARIELVQQQGTGLTDADERQLALTRLQVRYGLRDPVTLEPRSVWRRYGEWLGNALTFDLAGPGEDRERFTQRLRSALPVTLLVGVLALSLAAAAGIPLGGWLGMRAGGAGDRRMSLLLFVAAGLPEFLVATFLVLLFGGVLLDWFPTAGLYTDGSEGWSLPRRLLDMAWHLLLPVVTLALAPAMLIARFLRESVSRTDRSDFAVNLRAWGLPEEQVCKRVLRNALAPLATLVGSLLPMLVGGSVVVETVFSLDGLGRLAWDAVLGRDQGMVMALTLLASLVTLGGLLLSDLLQRAVDPRVRLS